MKLKQFFSKFFRNIDMTQGTISTQIFLFALPLILTNLLQQFYNMADSAVVGRFDSAAALAAVGTAGTTAAFLVNMIGGFVNGGSIVVAHSVGSGDGIMLKKTIHTTYALSIVIGIILTIAGYLFSPLLLHLLNVPDDIYAQTLLYVRIFFAGSIPNSIYCFSAGILRAEGDSRNPLIFLAIAGVTNVVLNIILIAGFHLGVAGVAIATVVSQIVSAVLSTVSLTRCDGISRLHLKELMLDKKIVKEILRLGIPASIQSSTFSISNMCIQAEVNQFGSTMIAGCTASGNIDGCLFQVTAAFATAATTFASQNYGAGNTKRIKKGAMQCSILSMSTVCALGLLITAFGRELLSLFNSETAVIDAGMLRLDVLIPTVFIYTGFEVLCGVVRGCGSPLIPMIFSIFGVCVFRLVWVYTLLPIFEKIEFVFYAYPVSYVLCLVLILVYYFVFQKHWLKKKEPGIAA